MGELRGKKILATVLSATMVVGNCALVNAADTSVTITGTYSSGSTRWAELADSEFTSTPKKGDTSIVIDSSIEYQKYEGIGTSLDETSVSNLWKLDEATREETIKMLVDSETGAGLDWFRITIGSPDCIEHIPFWSYDVLPEGVTEDWDLEYFSIEKDKEYHIIDTIKLIQKYNSDAKFYASAWSAPAWMTTSGTFTGYLENVNGTYVQKSQLRDDCIDVFAKYYAKTIKAFEEEGIHIYAITELNEPGMDVVYPAMNLTIEQQQKLAIAIKKEFAAQGIDTLLWAHDFNFWDWKYSDPTTKNYHRIFEGELGEEAKEAFDGVGFHPYWGEASVMKDTYYETGKPVYLTEAGGMDPGTILSYFRLNCSAYNGWTQVTDQNGGTLHWTDDKSTNYPETDIDAWTEIGNRSGAHWRGRLVTVNTNSGTVSYSSILSGLGQMAKYLDFGAQRVYSSDSANEITNVVYRNSETDTAEDYVMVINNTGGQKKVDVNMAGMSALLTVPSGFSTYRWTLNKSASGENTAPVINDVEDVTVLQFEEMSVQIYATDADNDGLTYYGLNVPSGAVVDPVSGKVTWTPGAAGVYEFEIAVTDGKEHSTVKFYVTVEAAPIPVPAHIPVGTTVQDGDVQTYTLKANEAGAYILAIDYSTPDYAAGNKKIDVAVDGTSVDSKNLAATWGGSGQVRLPITLGEGEHTLTLTYHDSGYVINSLDVTKSVIHAVPGKVEAENYANSNGVNLEPLNGGYTVSETGKGDWIEYNVDVAESGRYTLSVNAITPNTGVMMKVTVDGEDVTDNKGVITVPMTKTISSWGNGSTYKDGEESRLFTLTKGQHKVRLTFISNDGGNIDYVTFAKKSALVTEVFEDINEGEWYVDDIQHVYDNGIMSGRDSEHFQPAMNLTRADFALILYRMEGCPEVTYQEIFPDVEEDQYYAKAVSWASANGIVTGYTDTGLFKPADQITREQLMVMLYRYEKYIGAADLDVRGNLAEFSDGDLVSEYAKEAMEWAVGTGLIKGTGTNSSLASQSTANRAESATIICRFMEK